MPTYRNVSNSRLVIPRIGIVVEPGGEFTSDVEIDDGNYELVEDKKGPGAAPAEEAKP